MTITKDFLAEYKVICFVFCKQSNEEIQCNLLKVNQGNYEFTYIGSNKFFVQEKILLKVMFKKENSIIISKAKFIVHELTINTVIGEIIEAESDIDNVISYIQKIEYQDDKYGRRKEARIQIKKSFAIFGLARIEQKLISKELKLIQSCVLIDVSIHGLCIITNYNKMLRNIENFWIQLDFINPEQIIVLKLHKVYLKLTSTEKSKYITISCQILEPNSFIWKDRVFNLIEKRKIDYQ